MCVCGANQSICGTFRVKMPDVTCIIVLHIVCATKPSNGTRNSCHPDYSTWCGNVYTCITEKTHTKPPPHTTTTTPSFPHGQSPGSPPNQPPKAWKRSLVSLGSSTAYICTGILVSNIHTRLISTALLMSYKEPHDNNTIPKAQAAV